MILGWALSSPLEAARPRIATIDMAKAFESYHLTHAERNRVQEARKALLRDPRPETLKLLQVELGDLKGRIQDPGGEEKQRQQDYQRFLVKHHEYSTLKSEHEKDRSAKLHAARLRINPGHPAGDLRRAGARVSLRKSPLGS